MTAGPQGGPRSGSAAERSVRDAASSPLTPSNATAGRFAPCSSGGGALEPARARLDRRRGRDPRGASCLSRSPGERRMAADGRRALAAHGGRAVAALLRTITGSRIASAADDALNGGLRLL